MAIIYDLLELDGSPNVGDTLGVAGSGADVTLLGTETDATVADDVSDSTGGVATEAGLRVGSGGTYPTDIDGISHDVTTIREVTYDLGGVTYTGHVISVEPVGGGTESFFFLPEDGSDPVMGEVTILSATTIYFVDADDLAIDDNVTFPVCFMKGTQITTPTGPRAVETLKPGDHVVTLDHGAQPIRWTRSDTHALEESTTDDKPILIKAGALGTGLPIQDLIVSPQHRILVGGAGKLRKVFTTEAFAPAKSLTSLPGIRQMKGKTQISWIHFACDRHEVVFANDCLSESLLLGPMVMNGLTSTERQTLTEIFGSAQSPDAALNGPPARECLKVGVVRRHLAKCLKEKGRRTAKDIRKWDVDLAMEQYEGERLREAKSMNQTHNRAIGGASRRIEVDARVVRPDVYIDHVCQHE